MTLFERLMKARISSPPDAAAVPFAEIFDVLINVSSAVGAKGHLKLLQNVQSWIAQRYLMIFDIMPYVLQ